MLLALTTLAQAPETHWVPYTATFTETVVDTDASGRELNKQVTGGQEIRAVTVPSWSPRLSMASG
jgi:hypothetical protein